MPGYFADTSAVAKLYLDEAGSSWIQSLDLSGLAVSALTGAEFAAALARRERAGVIDARGADLAWRNFRIDARHWLVIGLARPVLMSAVGLLRDRSLPVPLRALDALQLACALEAQRRGRLRGLAPMVFLAADDRLETAAQQLGLPTDNPNRHP